MKLISIISNTNGNLIAEQHPQTVSFLLGFLALALIGLAIYLVWMRTWRMLILPILGLALLLFLSHIGQKTTYRVDINQQTRQITSEELKDGKVISSTTTPASDLTSAEMQFNRGARKIVLIHRDGHQSFPLGEQELQDEPGQYVILNALRQVIGQSPVPPQ